MADRTIHSCFALLLAAVLVSGCSTMGVKPPAPPTVEEVVTWSNAGMPAEEIITRMQEARAVYRLPASELAKLREQGVTDRVIDYMNQTQIAAARREEAWHQFDRYMWYGWPYGYPYRWYGPPYAPFGPFWY